MKNDLLILTVRCARWLPTSLSSKQVVWVAKEIAKHLAALDRHDQRLGQKDYDSGKADTLLDGRLRKLRKRLNLVAEGAGELVSFGQELGENTVLFNDA